ncbi:MAG: WD40 repeat protein, partial [Cryomorphaceae bacterium]
MMKPGDTFTGIIISVLLFSFLILMKSSTSAQIFVEEGLERGVDAIIATSGLGGPGVSSIDFDQDGDDDLTLGNNGTVFFYQNNEGQFQLIDLDIETPPGEIRGVMWTDINNDGNLDLLISSYNGEIRLYKNIGE